MPNSGRKTRNTRTVIAAFLAAIFTGLYIALAVATGPHVPASDPPVWLTSMDAARNLSRSTGKPILVDFGAPWCNPCQAMLQNTFPSPEVQPLLSNVICVRIDVDENQALAQQHQVGPIPRILLIASNGAKKMDVTGYEDPDSFAADLRNGLGNPGS